MAAGGKSLTRVDLYDAVYRKVGLSRVESTSFVELFFKGNNRLHCPRGDSQTVIVRHVHRSQERPAHGPEPEDRH
jgi:hypothetical protein